LFNYLPISVGILIELLLFEDVSFALATVTLACISQVVCYQQPALCEPILKMILFNKTDSIAEFFITSRPNQNQIRISVHF